MATTIPCIDEGKHNIILQAGFIPFCSWCGMSMSEIRGENNDA